MEEGKGIDDPRYKTSVLSSGQLDLVGASKMARGRWRRRKKKKKKKTVVGARLLADDNVKNEKARGQLRGTKCFPPS